MLDNVYSSRQLRHPGNANPLNKTMTAINLPLSEAVTLKSVERDWGYLQESPMHAGDLISTPLWCFCYRYDVVL
jgi:hypothetical protein